jgi:hypothetical protein
VAAMLAVMNQLCLNNAINRANIHALVSVEMTFAFNAFVGVDLENHIAFENSFSGANRFTSSARNAVIQYFHCHDNNLLYSSYQKVIFD